MPVDFYEIPKNLLPTLPWFPRTEDMAERVADLIVDNRFVVKFGEMTAPLIEAAAMRNDLLGQETVRVFLDDLITDDHIILYDSENHPPILANLSDTKSGYVDFLSYEDCIIFAEDELNNLLRFGNFDYRRYMLYLGAAFALVRASHPDWIFEAFIECFRKDVVDRMSKRTKSYLGYREFVDSLSMENE